MVPQLQSAQHLCSPYKRCCLDKSAQSMGGAKKGGRGYRVGLCLVLTHVEKLNAIRISIAATVE